MRSFQGVLVVLVCIACGGTVENGSDGGAGGNGGGIANPDIGTEGERKQACEHWFSAQSVCNTPPPPTEAARLAAQFEASCNVAFDQEGATTAKDIEACAAAMEASSCESTAGPPVACRFRGSLSAGVPCISSTQCASGVCSAGNSAGGPHAITCGTCASPAALGQACDYACPKGAVCVPGDIMGHDPAYRCAAIVEGDIGATCDDLALLCKAGLYCGYVTNAAAPRKECFPLGKLGERCVGSGAVGCVTPLRCVGTDQTCQAPAPEGGACTNSFATRECATGFGCDNGVCKPITWAEPGEPCDGSSKLCRLATCPRPTFQGAPPSTCPSVIADGMPCTAGDVCDGDSHCVNEGAQGPVTTGVCKSLSSVMCK